MSSSRGQPQSSIRQWARGVKNELKDGVKRILRSVTPSRSTTPRPGEENRGVEGPGNVDEPSETDANTLQIPLVGSSRTGSQSAILLLSCLSSGSTILPPHGFQ
ncbi:hypothetical protein FA13DRAFT_1729204 [Coprinellus micaceus]|uniref:Uncharacterized protein n=1 Tax=Coprinellus micaceus TaxID=71717 RepID=A0A4Y7TKU4_COPMI|nr:hypothetical protein FA13DRAFT_1729204 [Coprinellus micaceus]